MMNFLSIYNIIPSWFVQLIFPVSKYMVLQTPWKVSVGYIDNTAIFVEVWTLNSLVQNLEFLWMSTRKCQVFTVKQV